MNKTEFFSALSFLEGGVETDFHLMKRAFSQTPKITSDTYVPLPTSRGYE